MRREWLALAFAMTFPTLTAWVYFLALSTDPNAQVQPNDAMRLVYVLGKVVQFGFPIVYLAWVDRHRLQLAWPNFMEIGWGLGFGLFVGGTMLLLFHFALTGLFQRIGADQMVRRKVEELGAGTPGKFLLLAVFLSVIHSFMEEYYWRWFVYARLSMLVPTSAAVVLSSLAFMAHHVIVLYVYLPGQFLTMVVPFSLSIAVGGGFWAGLFRSTGSIGASWLSHLVVDAAIMWIGYSMVFR